MAIGRMEITGLVRLNIAEGKNMPQQRLCVQVLCSNDKFDQYQCHDI